ncbi:hypothetical protein [Methylobacterium sp. NFXW15]|uniref:hypothetical protein n=1 Tax=Methylobacterium sp. NFXW15 TaxID=2819512 RepID=UPI003CEB9B4D
MQPFVQSTDLLGLSFLLIALAGAGIAGASKGKRPVEDPRDYLAGGSLLVAILGLVFVLAE